MSDSVIATPTARPTRIRNPLVSTNLVLGRYATLPDGAHLWSSGELRQNYRATDELIPELPGMSVLARDGDDFFHTYSAYSRGIDIFNAAYEMLDMVPNGRDEDELAWSMEWLRRVRPLTRLPMALAHVQPRAAFRASATRI